MYKISFGFEREIFVVKLSKVKKASDVLVFRNELNSIIFPSSFTARDYDIFFTICWYVKQHDYDDARDYIDMPFDEIARFYEKDLNKTRFCNEIKEFCKKALGNNGTPVIRYEDDEKLRLSTFFMYLEPMRNKQILRLKMFKYSLNILFAVFDFMNINMRDFVSIHGKFSKTLYRLLKQYENLKADDNGFKTITFSKNKLLEFMNFDNNFYGNSSEIDRKILNPAIKELKDTFFKDLSVEKIKKNKREVVGYSFQVIF